MFAVPVAVTASVLIFCYMFPIFNRLICFRYQFSYNFLFYRSPIYAYLESSFNFSVKVEGQSQAVKGGFSVRPKVFQIVCQLQRSVPMMLIRSRIGLLGPTENSFGIYDFKSKVH